MCDQPKSVGESSLWTSLHFCISPPILKLEMTIFVIRNCQLGTLTSLTVSFPSWTCNREAKHHPGCVNKIEHLLQKWRESKMSSRSLSTVKLFLGGRHNLMSHKPEFYDQKPTTQALQNLMLKTWCSHLLIYLRGCRRRVRKHFLTAQHKQCEWSQVES